ncbi:MAG: BON domain-containing protein [Gemmatimonadaceae bacterium]
MEQREEPKQSQYPCGRGYGHDYMRGGEVFGGYGYSERTAYDRPRGDVGPEALGADVTGDPERERDQETLDGPSQLQHRLDGRGSHEGPYSDRIRTLQRPDDDLRKDIEEALFFDSWVDAGRIAVDVANGVVSLSGELTTDQERRFACDDAWAVAGVREVRSALRLET